MRDILEQKLGRFEQLENDLMNPEVLANSARISAVAREHGSLAKLAKKYRRFKELSREIREAQELAEGDDLDMRELAAAEVPGLREKREALWDELLTMTIGGEDANRTRLIIEVRAGTGGDGAALFARDLFDMYKHFCESKRWKIEIMDHSSTELGGFKEMTFSVEGDGCYRELQYESGGHRVQ